LALIQPLAAVAGSGGDPAPFMRLKFFFLPHTVPTGYCLQ